MPRVSAADLEPLVSGGHVSMLELKTMHKNKEIDIVTFVEMSKLLIGSDSAAEAAVPCAQSAQLRTGNRMHSIGKPHEAPAAAAGAGAGDSLNDKEDDEYRQGILRAEERENQDDDASPAAARRLRLAVGGSEPLGAPRVDLETFEFRAEIHF